MEQGQDYEKKAGVGLLIAGYIFAALGGLIGIGIGAYIAFGKVTLPDGTKAKKFDQSSTTQGIIIFVIAIVSLIFWNIMAG